MLVRRFSAAARCLNANASTNVEALIGSREAIAAKREQFEAKYRERLLDKAREKGVGLEELKEKARLKSKPAVSAKPDSGQRPTADALSKLPKSALPKPSSVGNPSIPPLTSILDVGKLLQREPPPLAEEIGKLWQAYHATLTSSSKLGAVVPLKQYQKMAKVAKKHAEFVIPLPRELEDGTQGAEMIFLQWAFMPAMPDLPAPSTVIFTSLAAFKAHGTFAQPALCLTHYTDLAQSHGIVLLRGEITTSDKGTPSMSATDGQLLCLRLQQYFASDADSERRQMLHDFHKGNVDLDKLVQTAWQVV